jgi:hypothetical protein
MTERMPGIGCGEAGACEIGYTRHGQWNGSTDTFKECGGECQMTSGRREAGYLSPPACAPYLIVDQAVAA